MEEIEDGCFSAAKSICLWRVRIENGGWKRGTAMLFSCSE